MVPLLDSKKKIQKCLAVKTVVVVVAEVDADTIHNSCKLVAEPIYKFVGVPKRVAHRCLVIFAWENFQNYGLRSPCRLIGIFQDYGGSQ